MDCPSYFYLRQDENNVEVENTILEYNVKVENSILTENNVCNSMAQNVGSSSNSPDVGVQDKIQGEVIWKWGMLMQFLILASQCLNLFYFQYKSKGTPNGTPGVNSTPEGTPASSMFGNQSKHSD